PFSRRSPLRSPFPTPPRRRPRRPRPPRRPPRSFLSPLQFPRDAPERFSSPRERSLSPRGFQSLRCPRSWRPSLFHSRRSPRPDWRLSRRLEPCESERRPRDPSRRPSLLRSDIHILFHCYICQIICRYSTRETSENRFHITY